MTEDAKDWTLDANVNVVAQTLAEMAVDIAAQSLGDLDVNINSQDLANLAVDIASQTLSNLTVDIASQTLSNLAVDIAAQTLSVLDVNISAQDLSNLNVDLNAQSVGNLAVDITAQTVEELYQRPTYGALQLIQGSGSLLGGESATLMNVSGKGKIYGGHIYIVESFALNNETRISIRADGEWLTGILYDDLLTKNVFIPGISLLFMIRYEPFEKSVTLGFSSDITFDSNFRVNLDAAPVNGLSYQHGIYYALV